MESGPGPAQTALNGRNPALDGIRALAALGVWVLHVGGHTNVVHQDGMVAWMASRLGIAVPVFFLLSGLLLYRPWARAVLEGAAPPRTGRYLWRRALRVLPAYWLVTVPVLLLWSAPDLADRLAWIFLLQNYAEDRQAADGLYQMWTMPVEAAFYVLLPVLAWLLHRWARGGDRPVRLLAGIAVLPLVSVASVVAADAFDQRQFALWLPHHLIFFAAGMALAVLSVWIGRSAAVAALAPQSLVLALLLYAVLSTELAGPRTLTLPTLSQALWRMALEASVAVLVVTPFVLGLGPGSLAYRVLGNPVMAYMGRISYSFFLWHAPVITLYYKLTGTPMFAGGFVRVALVTFVVTAPLSAATYHLVEANALRLSRLGRAPAPPPGPPPPQQAAPAL
ncbi:acyltransferase [Nonomuraea mesophila]|uniref:Acyltransferase n=1 Tax=Nonomuraea mesophila TaxID=2530382 RepID=A0A4R5F6S8_9ACTN|nr:acyltransferase [Nonomuraea mesophila]TDE43672.1 acyltransferase [Nonomuraea mesophila]